MNKWGCYMFGYLVCGTRPEFFLSSSPITFGAKIVTVTATMKRESNE